MAVQKAEKKAVSMVEQWVVQWVVVKGAKLVESSVG
jgi:hypothetical protein